MTFVFVGFFFWCFLFFVPPTTGVADNCWCHQKWIIRICCPPKGKSVHGLVDGAGGGVVLHVGVIMAPTCTPTCGVSWSCHQYFLMGNSCVIQGLFACRVAEWKVSVSQGLRFLLSCMHRFDAFVLLKPWPFSAKQINKNKLIVLCNTVLMLFKSHGLHCNNTLNIIRLKSVTIGDIKSHSVN